jgi:hypothetical protein
MKKEDILSQCIVEGNVVKLPPQQLERNLYLEVAKALQLIGGKWKGGKVAGFVFQSDPTELLAQIVTGQRRNLKKEYQFFATPAALADKLVEMAEIQPGNSVLEPSAGQGAIVQAIQRRHPGGTVDCFELMDINRSFLFKIPEVNFIGPDFLEAEPLSEYDRIVANPPFAKNQDSDHIRHMFDCLSPGGVLVSISSKHWTLSGNKKEKAFAEWLGSLSAEIVEIDSGEFQESGTMVGGYILKIKKNRRAGN